MQRDCYEGWSTKRLCDVGDFGSGADRRMAIMVGESAAVLPSGVGEITVRAGDLVISDVGALNRLRKAVVWDARVLLLPDRRIADRMDVGNTALMLAFDGTTRIGRTIRQVWSIGDEIASMDLGDRVIDATLIDLITTLGMALVSPTGGKAQSRHNKATVDRARIVIAANLASPTFGVAELSRSMRISARQLSSLFAPMGLTTARAILEMRIERGMKMLGDPLNARSQISSIALACGFEDQSYFARCFLRKVGRTPRQFRRDSVQLAHSGSEFST